MEASNQSISSTVQWVKIYSGQKLGAKWGLPDEMEGHCCYSSEHFTSGLLKWKEENSAPTCSPRNCLSQGTFPLYFWLKPCDMPKKHFSINTQNTL